MNLGHLVSIVQESRNLTALVFPLPDVADCVDYAITEAGEYLDAVLREKRQGDKRNHEKDSDRRKEWGQCGYMIASAMMQIENCPVETAIPPDNGGSVYSVLVSLCGYQRRVTDDPDWLAEALEDWSTVCECESWDATDLLMDTCAAFERKHLPSLFEDSNNG